MDKPINIAEVNQMIDKGLNYAQIAEKIGVKRDTLSVHMRRYGVSIRQRQKRYDKAFYEKLKRGLVAGKSYRMLSQEMNFSYEGFQSYLRKSKGVSLAEFKEMAFEEAGKLTVSNRADTPCLLSLRQWPVCYEHRCYNHPNCPAFQNGLNRNQQTKGANNG